MKEECRLGRDQWKEDDEGDRWESVARRTGERGVGITIESQQRKTGQDKGQRPGRERKIEMRSN